MNPNGRPTIDRVLDDGFFDGLEQKTANMFEPINELEPTPAESDMDATIY
jgi:hypothetical protein